VRHIQYKGGKYIGFLKKLAIGAVRPYGSNPPRLELHLKAGEVLSFLKDHMQGGNFHTDCEVKYNDNGDFHNVKVTIRHYIVLRWAQPSYKRFYNLKEGDTLVLILAKDGVIDAVLEAAPGGSEPSKMRAKAGEGSRKRKRKHVHPAGAGGAAVDESAITRQLRSPERSKLPPNRDQIAEIQRLARDMVDAQPNSITNRQIVFSTPVSCSPAGSGGAAGRGASGSPLALAASYQALCAEYEDVDAFLADQDLARYSVNFRKAEVTLKTLATGLITERHLQDMGLPIGPRLEILGALKSLVG